MQLLKLCLLLLLCPCPGSFGQTAFQHKLEIKIGQPVPDITFTNLHNYPTKTVKLSAFKGKLVILDFWATWCTLCIEAFSETQKMQDEFGDQLQVLLVNTYKPDDIKKVAFVMKRRDSNYREKIRLPYSLQQTLPDDYFPHQSVPHYAWIDKTGRLIATTSQLEITSSNIKAALAGNTSGIHMKQDNFNIDYKVPLFINGNGGNGKELLYQSVFSKYMEGLPSVSNIERTLDEKVNRIFLYNHTGMDMLRTAYPGKLNFTPNRIILNTPDSSLFMPGTSGDSLLYQNSFCYDMTTTPVNYEQALSYMRQDLFRMLHVKVIDGEREMPCLLLTPADAFKKLHSAGGNRVINIDRRNPQNYLQNQTLATFIDLLNYLPAARQLFILTSADGAQEIDLNLPAGFWEFDAAKLITYLQSLGLDCMLTTKKLSVAVVTCNE